MGWVSRWKSKNLVVDPDNPSGMGVCDRSGFVFNRKDLVEQQEWRGNRLVGTNIFVGKQYLDTPQQQNRPPIVLPDPVPFKKPRPEQPSEPVPPYDAVVRSLNQTRFNS
jgi:hypothetical protein